MCTPTFKSLGRPLEFWYVSQLVSEWGQCIYQGTISFVWMKEKLFLVNVSECPDSWGAEWDVVFEPLTFFYIIMRLPPSSWDRINIFFLIFGHFALYTPLVFERSTLLFRKEDRMDSAVGFTFYLLNFRAKWGRQFHLPTKHSVI